MCVCPKTSAHISQILSPWCAPNTAWLPELQGKNTVRLFQVPRLPGKILTLCCILWCCNGRRRHFSEDIMGCGLQALWILLCSVSCPLPALTPSYLDEHSWDVFCPLSLLFTCFCPYLGSTSVPVTQLPFSYDRSYSTVFQDGSLTTINQRCLPFPLS